jgi:hypothetical protein
MITRSLSLIMPHRHSRKRLVLTSSQWLQLLVGAMPSSCTRGRTLQRYFSCMQKLMQDELQNHRIRANRHFAGLYYHRPRAVTIPLIHFMIRFALAFITDPSLSLSLSPGSRDQGGPLFLAPTWLCGGWRIRRWREAPHWRRSHSDCLALAWLKGGAGMAHAYACLCLMKQ